MFRPPHLPSAAASKTLDEPIAAQRARVRQLRPESIDDAGADVRERDNEEDTARTL